jgi:hypothetical protein
MISTLAGTAALMQAIMTPPPPLANTTTSFDALSFECSIARTGGAKDEFSGHFGPMDASRQRPVSPAKVEFAVDEDTTGHFLAAHDAMSVDGSHYSSFIGWPDMWRLVFSFGKPNASGARVGMVTVDSFTFATLNSTEQWRCSAERHDRH